MRRLNHSPPLPLCGRTCLYTLGMLGKTRRGCDVLKQQGWDAVCHSSLTPWPLVPQEVGLQTQACDALPPPLRMRRPQSVSPRSRRYSEGSQPPGRHGESEALPLMVCVSTLTVMRYDSILLITDCFINPRWEIRDDDVIRNNVI